MRQRKGEEQRGKRRRERGKERGRKGRKERGGDYRLLPTLTTTFLQPNSRPGKEPCLMKVKGPGAGPSAC